MLAFVERIKLEANDIIDVTLTRLGTLSLALTALEREIVLSFQFSSFRAATQREHSRTVSFLVARNSRAQTQRDAVSRHCHCETEALSNEPDYAGIIFFLSRVPSPLRRRRDVGKQKAGYLNRDERITARRLERVP